MSYVKRYRTYGLHICSCTFLGDVQIYYSALYVYSMYYQNIQQFTITFPNNRDFFVSLILLHRKGIKYRVQSIIVMLYLLHTYDLIEKKASLILQRTTKSVNYNISFCFTIKYKQSYEYSVSLEFDCIVVCR